MSHNTKHASQTCWPLSPAGNLPDLAADSGSSSTPSIARLHGLDYDPFPLTPALSPRRGSTVARARIDSERSDSPQGGIRFSLSLGERAGVRGNRNPHNARPPDWAGRAVELRRDARLRAVPRFKPQALRKVANIANA